jgi:hypothetical protein
MRETLGVFVVATAIGLYVGSSFSRARRSRRDYAAGVKAMRTYRGTMRRETRRALFVVGSFVVLVAAMFVAAARVGEQ